ncbi:hypothetical protein tinsulaeT_08340 [Thalassotalea insulae]|uniref:PilZ domain-containing protein n=1 Tax=Thalassotalea insulae TaxID=2056778 RepID=A0ABQ6GQA4_9GAMM|nr:PilZ domain-containing protein [Thalassotalea insulae]GLX77494.1 hypothetical protein tinsulaeT_08340 [Thalassotalea insulae]
MTMQANQDKLAQYAQFFTIEHSFSINVKTLDNKQVSDFSQFLEQMPTPFKMVGEMSTIDQAALKPLQALTGVAGQLVDYLKHQAQKIDLLMNYILQQQNEDNARFQGVSFGGAGIAFISDKPWQLNQLVELKLFLPEENAAIYCFAEVIDISPQEQQFHHKLLFHFIRDEDRELLVRASLHKQTKQLQQLAQQRQQNTEH